MEIDGHQNDRLGHQITKERDHTGSADSLRSKRDASGLGRRERRAKRRESQCGRDRRARPFRRDRQERAVRHGAVNTRQARWRTADRTNAAEFSNTQGVAAVLRKVGRLSARRRDLAPTRVAGRVRCPASHLFNGPLGTSIQTRQRSGGHTARRLASHGGTRNEASGAQSDRITDHQGTRGGATDRRATATSHNARDARGRRRTARRLGRTLRGSSIL